MTIYRIFGLLAERMLLDKNMSKEDFQMGTNILLHAMQYLERTGRGWII